MINDCHPDDTVHGVLAAVPARSAGRRRRRRRRRRRVLVVEGDITSQLIKRYFLLVLSTRCLVQVDTGGGWVAVVLGVVQGFKPT